LILTKTQPLAAPKGAVSGLLIISVVNVIGHLSSEEKTFFCDPFLGEFALYIDEKGK